MIVGKKPNMLEKLWGMRVGVVFNCLLVRDASSMAVRSPMIVTVRAANFSSGGIDITGVLRGVMLEVIRRPEIRLPQASRLRGLITAGLFSLIGDRGLKRGKPIGTKKIMRKL